MKEYFSRWYTKDVPFRAEFIVRWRLFRIEIWKRLILAKLRVAYWYDLARIYFR